MKQIIKLLLLLFATVCSYSCLKQPTANFTTDKDTYTAGETVHLTDISMDAYHWKWVFPDGTSSNEKNVDYIIDINEIDCAKNITLEVASKKNKRAASLTKAITIKQAILPSDYYTTDDNGYRRIPNLKKSETISGTNWHIFISDGKFGLSIIFPESNRPTIGKTYTLKNDYTNLLSEEAYISANYSTTEHNEFVKSLSGQLTITIESNGKVHVIFNDINVEKIVTDHFVQISDTFYAMSGNVICY